MDGPLGDGVSSNSEYAYILSRFRKNRGDEPVVVQSATKMHEEWKEVLEIIGMETIQEEGEEIFDLLSQMSADLIRNPRQTVIHSRSKTAGKKEIREVEDTIHTLGECSKQIIGTNRNENKQWDRGRQSNAVRIVEVEERSASHMTNDTTPTQPKSITVSRPHLRTGI